MKKLYIAIVLTLLINTAFAQMLKPNKKQLSGKPTSSMSLMSRADSSVYINYADLMYNNTTTNAYYYNFLFPDSSVQIEYTTGYSYVGIHSVGQVFDPTAPNLGLYGSALVPITQYMGYTVDSVFIGHEYHRFQDANPDTLRIHFLKGNEIDEVEDPGTGWGDASYATVDFDTADVNSSNYTSEVVVLLDMDDTTSGKYLSVPVGINVGENEVFAYTLTYYPGNPYSFGDTLDPYATSPVVNKINAFAIYDMGEEDLTSIEHGYYNHELFAFSSIRYAYNAQGWNGSYIPGTAYSTVVYNADAYFRITFNADELSVNEVPEAKVAVSPNPAGNNINFAANMNGDCQVSIKNVLGQTIATENKQMVSGNSTSFDISNLTNGVYFLEISNVGGKATAKFVKN